MRNKFLISKLSKAITAVTFASLPCVSWADCDVVKGQHAIATAGSSCTLNIDTDTNIDPVTLEHTLSTAHYALGAGGAGAELNVNDSLTIYGGSYDRAAVIVGRGTGGGGTINLNGDNYKIYTTGLAAHGIEVSGSSSDHISTVNIKNNVNIQVTGGNFTRGIFSSGGILNIGGHLGLKYRGLAGISITNGAVVNLNTATLEGNGYGIGFEGATNGGTVISTGHISIIANTSAHGDWPGSSDGIYNVSGGLVDLQSSDIKTTTHPGFNNPGYGIRVHNDGTVIIRDKLTIETNANGSHGVDIQTGGKFDAGSGSIVTNGNNTIGFNEILTDDINRALKMDVATNGENSTAVNLQSDGNVTFVSANTLTTNTSTSNGLIVSAGADKSANLGIHGAIESAGNGIIVNQAQDANLSVNGSVIAKNGSTAIDLAKVSSGANVSSVGGAIKADIDAYAIKGSETGINNITLSNQAHLVGNVLLGDKNDIFAADNSTLEGTIDMGLGDDNITIANNSNVANLVSINAGEGNDQLTVFNNVFAGYTSATDDVSNGTNLQGLNTIALQSNSVFTQNGDLFEESTTNDALLDIDSSSTWQLGSVTQAVINGNVNNAGIMNLTAGGTSTASNEVTIKGNYVGNGGLLKFNTVLGDDSSATDRLVIEGDTSGTTNVAVNNLGGQGAETIQGIKLIQVNGLSEGEFKQQGRIVAGAYDYTLGRGQGEDASDWFLTSKLSPSTGGGGIDTLRPEAGTYLGLMEYNQTAFNHSFHDRQQLLDNQYQSAWGRIVYEKSKSRAGKQLNNEADKKLIHFGLDVYQKDALHLGVMAGYSKGDLDTNSRLTGHKAHAKSEGYSAGLYATWFDQNKDEGLYVDSYAQYNWFRNKLNGAQLDQETFNTRGYTLSLETGYGFKLGSSQNTTWFVEPQAQIIHNQNTMKHHKEHNGTIVRGKQNSDTISRLGVRFHGKSEHFQPFVTFNYWNHSNQAKVSMDNTRVKSDKARDIFEVKVGGQYAITKQLSVYGQLSTAAGHEGTKNYGGDVGLKYNW